MPPTMTPMPVTGDERDLVLAVRALTAAKNAGHAARTEADKQKKEADKHNKAVADALAVIRKVTGE